MISTKYFFQYIGLSTILFFSSSCTDNGYEKQSWRQKAPAVKITGRDDGLSLKRPDIYQVNIPVGWISRNPSKNEYLADTKKALLETSIFEGDEHVLITIHNFPADELNSRISPQAQVNRWRQQLGVENAKNIKTEQQAFGGFSGLRFQGEGKVDGKEQVIIAWAMQVSPEHFYALSQEHEGLTSVEREQMRADYTIKAVGSPKIMEKYSSQIDAFARSFRLINPIPNKR